jgi:hypothetical protein
MTFNATEDAVELDVVEPPPSVVASGRRLDDRTPFDVRALVHAPFADWLFWNLCTRRGGGVSVRWFPNWVLTAFWQWSLTSGPPIEPRPCWWDFVSASGPSPPRARLDAWAEAA